MDDDTPYKLDHEHLGISVLRHPFTRLASQYSFDRKKAKNKQFQQETIRTKGNRPFHECAAQDSCVKTNEFARWCSLQTRYTHAHTLSRVRMHTRAVREQFEGGRLLRESSLLLLAVTADETRAREEGRERAGGGKGERARESEQGKASKGERAWESEQGKASKGERARASEHGRASKGKRAWESEQGRASKGERARASE